jgi:hypothetical protein
VSSAREHTTHEDPRAHALLRLAAWAPLILIAALFASQLVALAEYRVDYPINDDWRYYGYRYQLPAELSAAWLLTPSKDTLHVSGKLLDWTFFRYVAHDYRHMAVASFIVCLGSWLGGALALCAMTTRARPGVLFASLLTFALPLAAIPYWVTASSRQWLEPMIAYHQMLPLVGLFLLALLCVADRSRWPRGLDLALAALVSVFFSLSYSSGALALTVLGGALVLSSALGARSPQRSSATALGATILAVAGLCLVAHVVGPLRFHSLNPVLEPRGHAMAYPWTQHFWVFLFSLFDRAVLSTATDGTAMARGAAAAAVVVVPLIGLVFLAATRRLEPRAHLLAMVLVATILAVVAYAALVAYGRGNFGRFYLPDRLPPDLRASAYAHHRFFYWWISAVLPLSVISWGMLVEALVSRRVASAATIALAILLLVPKSQGPAEGTYMRHWSFAALYEHDAVELSQLIERDVSRSRGIPATSPRRKLWMQLPAEQRNRSFELFVNDSYKRRRPVYERAREMGARFMEKSELQ